jgi:integrase
MMSGVGDNTQKYKVLIAILYLTGHRINEILKLHREDVELVNKKLVFHILVSKRREFFRHDIYVGESSPYVNMINDYVQTLDSGKLLFESEYELDTPITRQYVGIILRRLDPTVHPHLFRHTRATMFARSGYSEWQIQAWFGWKTSGMATNYVSKGSAMLGDMGDHVR